MKIQKLKIKVQIAAGALCLLTLSGFAQGGEGVALKSLLDEAKNNNPQIQEAFNNWKAAE